MRRLRSWTGAVFAALYALAFIALYVDYVRRAGTWFADLPLSLAALPFTLLMRALNGGSFAFGGDMTGRVIAAGAVRLRARLSRGPDRGDDRSLSACDWRWTRARRGSGPNVQKLKTSAAYDAGLAF